MFSANSRSLPSELAYKNVFAAVNELKEQKINLYSKRIDSTLRGNLGSETDAFSDVLGDGKLAIVVPCLPQAKRITIGGHMLVNGVLLRKREI